MTRMILPVAALLLGVAAFNLGNALQGVLLPVRAQMEGFSAAEIGLLGSANFVGFLIGCLRGPRLVARVGHMRVFAAMVALASCAILLHGLAVSPWVWAAVRASSGFCFSILFMVTESWLGEKADPRARASVFSIYAVLLHLTGTVGQGAVALADPRAFDAFAVGSVLISLSAIPMLLTRIDQPRPLHGARIALGKLWRASPVAVAGAVGAGLANGAFAALLPLSVAEQGVSAANVALLMAASALAAAVMQWPLGALSDRVDRRLPIVAACLAAISAAGVIGFRPDGPAGAVLFAGVALYGAFAYPVYVLSVAHAGDLTAPEDHVATSSGLLFLWSAGAVAGPVAASAAIAATTPDALFAFTASVHALVALFALWRMTRRGAAPAADKTDFSDAAVMAATLSEVETDENAAASPG